MSAQSSRCICWNGRGWPRVFLPMGSGAKRASIAVARQLTRGWPFVVRFSQAEVQAAIDRKLPFASADSLCRVDTARVTLRDDGRIQLDASFHLQAGDRSIAGVLVGVTRPSYR